MKPEDPPTPAPPSSSSSSISDRYGRLSGLPLSAGVGQLGGLLHAVLQTYMYAPSNLYRILTYIMIYIYNNSHRYVHYDTYFYA